MNAAFRHVLAGLMLSSVLMPTATIAQQPDVIRRLPYPFGQMITFSSDADGQAPWHGRAMHRYMNEKLGLPISDSMWINSASGSTNNSALFSSTSTLDARLTGVEQHSVFGLLVREWHRGNIDHFHSWTEDGLPQYKFTLPQPLGFSSEGVIETPVRRGGWMIDFQTLGGKKGKGYQQLRLLFDELPPEDMEIEARFEDGTSQLFPAIVVRQFRTQSNIGSQVPATVTVFLNEPPPMGISIEPLAKTAMLTGLLLRSPSCRSNCSSRLNGIERDNFSRWLVAAQLPLIEKLNIRPALFTSHGGWTFHPSFAGDGPPYKYDFSSFNDKNAPTVRELGRGLGAVSASHAYYADYLHKLGIKTLTSISNGDPTEINDWWLVLPPPVPRYGIFYATSKTRLDFGLHTDDLNLIIENHAKNDPSIRDANLQNILCSTNLYCRNGAQGSTIGALLAVGQAMMNNGRKVEHHWYTHFGTARFDPSFTATMENPFPHHAMEQLRKLAISYYDPSGNRPAHKRAWVPPSGVWSMYRIMRHVLPGQVRVNQETSAVEIKSVMDQTLGIPLPDPAAGTRDLNGITIYVPDSARASATLNGERIDWFTRNGADETGQQSITIIGDNSPIPILSKVDPAISGQVSVSGAQVGWISADTANTMAGIPAQHLRLTAMDDHPLVRLMPHDLSIWNATHIGLRYRVHRLDGKTPRGHAFITFVRKDGSRITLEQGAMQKSPPRGADLGWWLSPAKGQDWVTESRAQYEVVWASGSEMRQALPLLIGKIQSIEIGMADAAQGDILDIGDMFAFQSTANGVPKDGLLLVGGQVLGEDGAPLARTPVKISQPDGSEISISTDASGYYFARIAQRGDVIKIVASTSSKQNCSPVRGASIEITRNEAELDIDMQKCL